MADFSQLAPYQLKAHLEKCHFEAIREIKTLKCQSCSYKTGHHTSFENHVKKKSDASRKFETCLFCDMICKDNAQSRLHHERCRMKDGATFVVRMPVKSAKSKCSLCTAEFIQETAFKSHQAKCHFEALSDIKVLSCKNCAFKTGHLPSYEKHCNGAVSCRPDKEYFKCDYCDQMLVVECNRQLHIKSFHYDKFLEDSKKENEASSDTEIDPKSFECDLCMAQFNRKLLLDAHTEKCHFQSSSK